MNRKTWKALRKLAVTAVVLALAFYFIPIVTGLYLLCGLIDVLRNRRKNLALFQGYFLGNGLFTFLLSPVNLLADLLSYRNHGVWYLDQLPKAHRQEVEEVLGVFRQRRNEIIADIDANFSGGRRGMYVYQWYGKQHIENMPEFTRHYKYIRTIAVSVFNGRESTSFHFGPLRLSLRVLYNLVPVPSDRIFIECGDVKHYRHDDPLFIFDDTLLHRSVNEYDGRRYCVFMDVIRPSAVPGVLAALMALVSHMVGGVNAIFYRNWKMIGSSQGHAASAKQS